MGRKGRVKRREFFLHRVDQLADGKDMRRKKRRRRKRRRRRRRKRTPHSCPFSFAVSVLHWKA